MLGLVVLPPDVPAMSAGIAAGHGFILGPDRMSIHILRSYFDDAMAALPDPL